MTKQIIFLNGKFLDIAEAKIPVMSPGLIRGRGLFETMRSYNGKIVYFDAHLQRLKDACGVIGMKFPYASPGLKEFIRKTVLINKLKDAYVRLTLLENTRQADTLVIAGRYQPHPASVYSRGFRACVSGFRQDRGSLLAQVKSTSRLLYEAAYSQARKRGFEEALLLNENGYLSEGTRSNIFLVKDKEIFTSSLECGCLAGITRRVVFDLAARKGVKIYEARLTMPDLYDADEAFLTNSLMGIMPLGRIEKRRLYPGAMTKYFMKQYERILKNGT